MSDSNTEAVIIGGEDVTAEPQSDARSEMQSGIQIDDTLAGVEESRRRLADVERAREQSEQARRRAERDAAAARAQVQRMQQQRQQDSRAMVQAALAQVEAQIASATSAYRLAREAGDLDAEIAANQELQAAAAQRALLQSQGAAAGQDQQAGSDPQADMVVVNGRTLTRRSADWVRSHPRFNTDRAYRGVAIDAHNEAQQLGLAVDSPEYFDHIERALDEQFGGDDRSQSRGNGGSQEMSSSGGAPPTRHQGGSVSGRTVSTLFGPLIVRRSASGGMQIQIPPDRRADWEEAARINGMSLGDYCKSQVEIAEERAQGGNGGLITAEGMVYR